MQKAKAPTPLGKVALVLAFGLAGCNQNSLDSQIEKCVQAKVKASMEYYQEVEARNAAKFGPDWKAKERELASGPYAAFGPESVQSKASVESQARLVCLKVAAGGAR
jgi:hypothetical protein